MQGNRSGWERDFAVLLVPLITYWLNTECFFRLPDKLEWHWWPLTQIHVLPHSLLHHSLNLLGIPTASLSPACPHRFLCLLGVQVPSHPSINTLLITQQKPAMNLKIPFSIPVRRSLWALWLCTTRAVLHGSCDTAPGEQKWQQMSQEMPPSLPRINLGSSYTVTTRGSYWHVTSRVFKDKTLIFWLCIKKGWWTVLF